MLEAILKRPFFYNLWSALYLRAAAQAVAEIIPSDSRAAILDVGCGTGRLQRFFPRADFTGIDHNRRYIAYARKHYRGRFITGDIAALEALVDGLRFDYIILCGLLHHLEASQAARTMSALRGHVHTRSMLLVVDHVYAQDLGLFNKTLLKLDRGAHIRTAQDYHNLFANFTLISYKQITLQVGPLVLWTSFTRFVLRPA